MEIDESWRSSAVLISKYNPVFRDEKGVYTKEEWVSFFQIGKKFDDGILSFAEYEAIEKKYINAALLFFEFHSCHDVVIRRLEKKEIWDYDYSDKHELIALYNKLTENYICSRENLPLLLMLIFRELVWAELHCFDCKDIVLRFGYDFYMYFNSNIIMDKLFSRIIDLGLFVER